MDRSTITVFPFLDVAYFLGDALRSHSKEINFYNSWLIKEELVVVWEH
jgi:hypothetical protein